MPELKGRILEYRADTYEGTPYANVKIRANDVAKDAILKYKVDVKRVGDLSALVDQEVVFQVEIVRGQNDSAGVKVISVVPVNKAK